MRRSTDRARAGEGGLTKDLGGKPAGFLGKEGGPGEYDWGDDDGRWKDETLGKKKRQGWGRAGEGRFKSGR